MSFYLIDIRIDKHLHNFYVALILFDEETIVRLWNQKL